MNRYGKKNLSLLFLQGLKFLKKKGSFCSVGNTCADLARIHNGGPYGCGSNTTEYYGWLIARCLRREAPYEKIDTFPIPN
jgi:hypothetical protein